jgi:hypothetical protein
MANPVQMRIIALTQNNLRIISLYKFVFDEILITPRWQAEDFILYV